MHCRKSPLFCEGEAWSKKSYGRFDVTMGSFDGAEVCELVGLYLLHHLSGILGKEAVGLCRDDGLAILRNTLGPNAERLKKQIIQIFHQHDLKDAILVRTDFLDETLDLSSGRYWSYQKPNDHPLYIDIRSNHPPTIKRQLPSMTEKRLSQISCDKSEFQTAIPMYEQALQASGHHQKLQFQQEQANQGRRTRERNITWFNPPYNDLVNTNVRKRFFYLLEKHFPSRHRLHKVFTKNTIKLSYSCTTNMAGILSFHNKKILSEKRDKPDPPSCNCRKTPCPMSGRCREKSIVYKATANCNNEAKNYFGLCETDLKHDITITCNPSGTAKQATPPSFPSAYGLGETPAMNPPSRGALFATQSHTSKETSKIFHPHGRPQHNVKLTY